MSSSLTKPTTPGNTPPANPNTPQVPTPQASLAALAYCVQQLKQAMDSLCGFRGRSTDRAVTYNDLISLGVISLATALSQTGTVLTSNPSVGTATLAATNVIVATGLQTFIFTTASVGGSIDIASGIIGQKMSLHVKQGSVAKTVTLSANFIFPTGGSYTSGAANKRDILHIECLDGTVWAVTNITQGYTT